MLINFLCGVLGNLFIILNSLNSSKTLAANSKVEFSFKKYFEREAIAIITGFIPLFIYLLTYDEATAVAPKLVLIQKISFAVVGAIGSWIFLQLLGKTKRWVRGIIDEKTNELDEIKNTQPGQ